MNRKAGFLMHLKTLLVFLETATLLLPTASQKTLNVGLLCSNGSALLDPIVGFDQVAAGIIVSWQRVQQENLMPDITNINLTWRFDNCAESASAKYVIDYINDGVDVIIGPPCSNGIIISGSIAKFYDFPLFVWGPLFSSQIDNIDNYPTVVAVSSSANAQADALLLVMQQFDWFDIAIIYGTELVAEAPRCSFVVAAISDLMSNTPDRNIATIQQVRGGTVEQFARSLDSVIPYSRIVIVCLETEDWRRNFLLACAQLGLTTPEWAFVYCETRRTGFNQPGGVPFYVSLVADGRDAQALLAARRTFVLDQQEFNDTQLLQRQLEAAFIEPPFDCADCANSIDAETSRVTDVMDAFYLYALARNRTLTAHPNLMANDSARISGTLLSDVAAGQFEGQTGLVRINANSSRDPIFMLYQLSARDAPRAVVRIETNSDDSAAIIVWNPLYSSPSELWATWGGSPPLNVPRCGYDGASCPLSFTDQYLAVLIGAAALVACIFAVSIAAIAYAIRRRRRQSEERDRLWQVAFNLLQKPTQKSLVASAYSLQSSVTTSTRITLDSKRETETHAFFFLGADAVIARKHAAGGERLVLEKDVRAELRQLHKLEHDNANKFVGVCLDGPVLMTIWRYCHRGSLEDVMEKSSLQMDWFFKYSLIRDICEGIDFLHHAPLLGAHGWISSRTCVVDERWQVKLTYNGLSFLKARETRPTRELLWTAPEHIRDGGPSRAGDIYSFAIVCSEVITRRPAWDLPNLDMDIDEVIYKLKKGGRAAPRPALDTDDHDVNSSMLLFVKDCWSEEPAARPSSEQAKSLIKSFNHGRSANLMDHVFNVLEQYATTLEEDVETRMKELVEEKKRSDLLLYRMLPKQVADKLKLGQSVEPETFECVSIFFSDVVSFTTLASRCTPLQVVNLLNDLYTAFDAIIDEHDVYKVETIGDGYLCVSGLPHRNGNEHAREVAEMSLELLDAIKKFRIPHLPSERISIRIGLHTGPCVAGVVGITMPRYCLFGDSVNTAARMESNGRPGRIHISDETNRFLTSVIGGYRTESRGEVLIKGKGTLNTFWLLTPDEISL